MDFLGTSLGPAAGGIGGSAPAVSATYVNAELAGAAGKIHVSPSCSVVEQFHAGVSGPLAGKVPVVQCETSPGIGHHHGWS